MNILSVANYRVLSKSNNEKNNSVVSMPKFGLTMAKPLLNDTVSFKAKEVFANVVEHQVEKDLPRLKRLANVYFDTLESIARELAPYGVSFSRNYCNLSPVKSPSSTVGKMKRTSSFVVPDPVRGTIFVQNPYDLSILNNYILPALADRQMSIKPIDGNLEDLITKGYVPSMEEISGGEVKVPDLDIRLDNDKVDLKGLDPKYMYSLGNPQKSGYEDIQMRLVRDYDEKDNPVQHELLILMGKNYAFTKHIESEFVYNYLRKFGELNIIKRGNENIESHKATKSCISLLKNLFGNEVSKKLFANAKKLDLTGEKNLEKVEFNEETIKLIDKCFEELKKSVSSYYQTAQASKRISDVTKNKLKVFAKKDLEEIENIQAGLNRTIEYFNEKDYLKRRKDYWPTLFGEKFHKN